jgi:hypothetical protein
MTNAQKTPMSRTLPPFASQKAKDQIAQLGFAPTGKVLATQGSIVAVRFTVAGRKLPDMTIPVFGAEYIRLPIQPGDKGVAFPVSVYTGGVSGLGTLDSFGDSPPQGNLSTLVWFPVGNAAWSAVNPNVLVMYGPSGVTIRDTASGTVLNLTPTGLTITSTSGTITFTAGGKIITISATGITLDGLLWDTHYHAVSGSITGPPL